MIPEQSVFVIEFKNYVDALVHQMGTSLRSPKIAYKIAQIDPRKLKVYIDGLSSSLQEERRAKEPPKIAEFLFCIFANPRHVDSLLDNLEERFQRDCRELGPTRAARRYWAACSSPYCRC